MDNKRALFQKFVGFTTSVHEATHEFTKDIRPDEITPLQYGILEYLATSQPVTLSEISECLHISMPNTSRELKKLSEKQLCEKFDVAEDKRKQAIRLSREGQAIMNEAFLRIEARFLERIKGSTEEEIEELNKSIDLLQSKIFF